MPEPQIARRCPTCGVAIREVALFCPQCGNALPPRSSVQSQSTGDSPLAEADRKDTAPLDDAEVRSQANFSDTLVIERPDNQSDARTGAARAGPGGGKATARYEYGPRRGRGCGSTGTEGARNLQRRN